MKVPWGNVLYLFHNPRKGDIRLPVPAPSRGLLAVALFALLCLFMWTPIEWCSNILRYYRPLTALSVDATSMAIYRLIANGSFGPEEIKAMTAAYEAALLDLGLVDRDDPITEIVATAIVTVTSKGERDPTIIKDRALNAIGTRPYDSTAA